MAASRARFFRFNSIRMVSSLKSPPRFGPSLLPHLSRLHDKLPGFVPNSEQTSLGPTLSGTYYFAETGDVRGRWRGSWGPHWHPPHLGGLPLNFGLPVRN